MKPDYLLSEREGLAATLEQLQHFNTWASPLPNELTYDEEYLLQFFDAPLGDSIEGDVYNAVSAAIYVTVYSKNYIPKALKEPMAQRISRNYIANLENAKISYYEAVKGMPQREATARRKQNKMIKRVSILDNTVSWGLRQAAKAGISWGITALVTALAPTIAIPAAVIGLGSFLIISLIPEKVKKPVREFATKAIDTVVESVKTTAGFLLDRGVSVAKKVIDKGRGVFERIRNKVQQRFGQ